MKSFALPVQQIAGPEQDFTQGSISLWKTPEQSVGLFCKLTCTHGTEDRGTGTKKHTKSGKNSCNDNFRVFF